MNSHLSQSVALLLALLVNVTDLHAQAEQRPEKLLDEDETAAVEEQAEEELPEAEAPASAVVDVSEENFRRSMELRDQARQRSPDLTTGSYSRGTGLQALDDLPEESQKHLREQLREVIVENGPWTPADAGTAYPYVPSSQAQESPTLEKREQAAWGEMVSEYHQREAAIHSNAARTQAATLVDSSQAGQNPDGMSGESANGAEAAGQDSRSGSEQARAARAAALADMLGSGQPGQPGSPGGNPASAVQGTEQNALELLTQRQQLPAGASGQPGSESLAPAASQGETGNSDAEDDELALESEGVIRIDDLDKVRVDPGKLEDN